MQMPGAHQQVQGTTHKFQASTIRSQEPRIILQSINHYNAKTSDLNQAVQNYAVNVKYNIQNKKTQTKPPMYWFNINWELQIHINREIARNNNDKMIHSRFERVKYTTRTNQSKIESCRDEEKTVMKASVLV
ncbi:hypothetical protein KEM48_002944 [Puccinia striiformis f. sp. tritici PST-130]|nr:hypothetical protein KEM48_002944 [Puccinia striiformis f. sp. tritici PST-130]